VAQGDLIELHHREYPFKGCYGNRQDQCELQYSMRIGKAQMLICLDHLSGKLSRRHHVGQPPIIKHISNKSIKFTSKCLEAIHQNHLVLAESFLVSSSCQNQRLS